MESNICINLAHLNLKGLQNDIRQIGRGKLNIAESVEPIIDDLNGTGDNKVILW